MGGEWGVGVWGWGMGGEWGVGVWVQRRAQPLKRRGRCRWTAAGYTCNAYSRPGRIKRKWGFE